MKKIRALTVLLLLSISGCIGAAKANQNIDNSPAIRAKRAQECRNICNKEHYNIQFIRYDGTMEKYKVGIYSFGNKIGCECKF